MSTLKILNITAFVCGFAGFALSVLDNEPNLYALAAGMYALGEALSLD